MKIVSSTAKFSGPLYLDTSALAKLYLPEGETLNDLLLGRRDVIVSDLAVTEIVSALSRRRREGNIQRADATALYQKLLEHVESRMYCYVELLPAVHREAERLLLSLDVPLRVADALHLALAIRSGAHCLATYDQKLANAARVVGLQTLPN